MKTYYSRVGGVRTRAKTFSLESREVRVRLNTLAAVFLGTMFLLALAGCGRSKTQTEAPPATTPSTDQPTQRQSDGVAEKAARTNSAAALPAVQAEHKEGSDPSPCHVTFAEVEIVPGEADVTLDIQWQKDVPPLKQGDVTVAFVFAPEAFPIRSELFKLSREYEFGFAVLSRDSKTKSKNPPELLKMVSGLTITDKRGVSHNGAMLLFCTSNDSGIDLRKSRKRTFPIPIRSENRAAGQVAIEGEGVLTVAVFKQDDPKLDQLKSTSYKQLSEPVTKAVVLK